MEKQKSDRHKLADRIAKYINDNNLNLPFGGTVLLSKLNNHKFYSVLFSYPRTIDGEIAIYAPNFIQVTYKFGLREDNPVFDSEKTALNFIKYGFIDIDWDKANAIPRKPKKENND